MGPGERCCMITMAGTIVRGDVNDGERMGAEVGFLTWVKVFQVC